LKFSIIISFFRINVHKTSFCDKILGNVIQYDIVTLRKLKTYLRSVMNNDRLNNLAVLNIENELTSSINYDNIIEEFNESQSSKKILMY